MWVNHLTVYCSKDQNISCGRLALTITEALRAAEATAHISCAHVGIQSAFSANDLSLW